MLDVPPVWEQDCSRLWEQSYTAFLARSHTSAPQRWRTFLLALPHTFAVERPCNPLWKGAAGCWGNWGSPWDLLARLLWHQTALLPIHLLTFLSKRRFHNKKRVGKRSPWNYLACVIGLLETHLPIRKRLRIVRKNHLGTS